MRANSTIFELSNRQTFFASQLENPLLHIQSRCVAKHPCGKENNFEVAKILDLTWD